MIRRTVYACLMLMAAATLLISCKKDNPNYLAEVSDPSFYHRTIQEITDIMVYDIFSPPVASRIYSRAAIAGYEAMVPGYPAYQSLAGQLKNLDPMPKPEEGQEYAYPISSIKAMINVGRTLLFSEDKMNAYEQEILTEFRKIGVPEEVLVRSLAFGDSISAAILKWTSTDNYKQSRTFPKFSVNNEAIRWKPTPPAYMDAVEPHWNRQRLLFLDSAAQFKPAPPVPFSREKDSEFYKIASEVMEVVNRNDTNFNAIAAFWDCNPFVMHQHGHVMFATKKISPGGHWIGVAGQLCRQLNKSLAETAEVYALLSIGLYDGFIVCWDEKFRSNLVRPETYINENIDPEWTPILQTPPFPEHTSGHSVVSSVSAEILTLLLGDNISFTDSVEVAYGLFPRSFPSVKKAAQEACISRFYGGIHYMPAITEGAIQGAAIGKYIMERLKTRKG